jgi:hypothetical protein
MYPTHPVLLHFLTLARQVTDTSMVLAILADDECDKDIETHIRPALSDVQKHWDAAPDIPVYIGGSRNRYAGAFAR